MTLPRLRTLLLFALALVVLLTGGIIGLFWALGGQNKAVLHKEIALGLLEDLRQDEFTVELRNPTLKWIRIKTVQTTCGCTVVSPSDKPTPPFGKAAIPVTVNLAGKNGPFESKVSIQFDTGLRAEIAISGNVLPRAPRMLDFGRVLAGKPVERRFIVGTSGGADVDIKKVSVNSSQFAVQVIPSGDVASKQTVSVQLNATDLYGSFDSELILETDDTEIPRKAVRLVGYVLKPVEVDPAKISFGYVTPTSAVPIEIKLYSPYRRAFEFVSVSSREGFIRCEPLLNSKADAVRYSAILTDRIPDAGLYKDEIEFLVTIEGVENSAKVQVYGYSLPKLLQN
jgi:hypothetical protein